MRAILLLAGAALGLAACGDNDQVENTANVDQSLSAESIVANDVTAIDAVTGDAANMAADVDINFTNEQLATTDNRVGAQPTSRPSRPSTRRAIRPESNTTSSTPPTAQPASNTTANAVE
jgi:hypothetical protein